MSLAIIIEALRGVAFKFLRGNLVPVIISVAGDLSENQPLVYL